MASLQASKAIPLTQIAYAAASVTASYTVAGTFSSPVVNMYVVSTLDEPVQISFDGVNDHLVVPAGDTVPVYMQLDFKSNLICLPNPIIAVKEIGNPTTGSLYVCAFSGETP
jgi:hypothetical protein